MAIRLVKIAKELNVGYGTLVEHLNKKGHKIDNNPRVKVSQEIYDLLLNDFKKSIAIKEEADKLNIGTRKRKEAAEKQAALEREKREKERLRKEAEERQRQKEKEELIAKRRKEKAEQERKARELAAERARQEQLKAEKQKNKLKVLGKINLDAINPKTRPESKKQTGKPKPVERLAAKAKVEKPKSNVNKKPTPPVADKVSERKVVQKKEASKETPKPQPEKIKEEKMVTGTPPVVETPEVEEPKEIRAETPKLKGLKILGKIDTTKFNKPTKKKGPKEKPVREKVPKERRNRDDNRNRSDNRNRDDRRRRERDRGRDDKKGVGDNKGKNNNADKPKRRRKRKKIVKPTTVTPQNQNKTEKKGSDNRSGNNQNRDNRGRSNNNNNRSRGGRNDNNRRGRGRGGRNDNRRNNNNQPTEVSQKEIQEQIRATMARMSSGGKNKRQKLRRDNRERQREKQYLAEEQESSAVQVTEFSSVSELASLLELSVTDIIMTCMNAGVIVSINQRLDAEIIELIAEEHEREIEFISAEEQLEEEEEIVDAPEDLKPRAPIVTVMGHVDHGKTSLLDYIRKANVADGEAGGITQHIGAYEVKVDGQRVTFLDTPGHEAFTAMRARGAKVTDIAVIIVAADDSVMPQTKEAISHAQAAGVPIVFAINKIDKDGANPERIKEQLASMNFLVEDWGGKYQSQDISAKQGIGIEDLLEKIILEAEILELKANPKREASGVILEASLDKGRGYVAKMLVQTGTLKVGDPVVAGSHAGKVKAMFNERNKRVKKVGPSTPVLVLGLNGAPQAGEKFKVMPNEQEAKQLASKRERINREQQQRATKRITLDMIGQRLQMGNFKELNLIVKGDVDGSIEALSDSLLKQSIKSLQINIVHRAVGQITESDVLLAAASNAIIIGFQVRPSLSSRRLAEKEGVDIRLYSVIYDAIEEVRTAMEGMLETKKQKEITAQIEVREVYKISKVGTVAGCYVTEGKVFRNNYVTIVRNGIVVYPTKDGVHAELDSLKRFKDDVKEVNFGYECGIKVKNYNDIREGDILETYEIIEVKQTLKDLEKQERLESVES